MRAAVRQRQANEKRFDAENGTELRDDRNAPSLADERGIFAERFAQCALRGLPDRRMRISQVPRPTVASRNFHRDARRQMLFEMSGGEIQDLFTILIGHEPEGELGHRMAPDYGFGSNTLVTATDAIDLRRRPPPDSFQRGVTLFAKK